jgi:hypothetical protein
MLILNQSKRGCRAERFSFFDRMNKMNRMKTPDFQGGHLNHFVDFVNSVEGLVLDQMFPVIGPQTDRLVL